ncbi:YaaC family protein [Geodermatophilus sp. SYSU D00708]
MTRPTGPTYRDLLATPPAVAWRQLRTIRHEPPGAARRGDRKAVFGAAMEQAEQFFAAAQAVGPATKPVLLFYGLSQAARSVAAASLSARHDEWRLAGGHGLRVGPMQGVVRTGIASLELQDSGRGTFTGLARILGAASLPSATALGDLWCLVPAMELAPLTGMGEDAPLVLRAEDGMVLRSQRTRVRIAPLPSGLMQTEFLEDGASGDLANAIEAQRSAVSAYLNRFPTLQGWSFAMPEGNPIGATMVSAEEFEIPILLGRSTSAEAELKDILNRVFNYQGLTYAFPSVGSSTLPAHPLLLWYGILYGLSMLSRYEPKAWAHLISIDASADASPIEGALDEAMRTLPQVLLQTLHDVA